MSGRGRGTALEYFSGTGDPVLGRQRIFTILVLLVTVNPAFTGYSWSVPAREAKGFSSSVPQFDVSASSEISVTLGQPAYLPCVVNSLGDKLVSWIRTKDLQILTSGKVTFTADPRFDILYDPETESWTLRIRKARISDVGKYECQVNTDPKMNRFFSLSVSEAPLKDSPLPSSTSTSVKASISGPKQQYVKIGSTVTFECRLYFGGDPHWDRPQRVVTRSVPNVQWLHKGLAISFQAERGGISVETERAERTGSSRLTVASVGLGDAGRYTCTGPAIAPDTVTLHVIEGEHTEAMQRDESIGSSSSAARFSGFLILSSEISGVFMQNTLLFAIVCVISSVWLFKLR